MFSIRSGFSWPLAVVVEIAFFLGFFLGLKLWVMPVLQYHNADPDVFTKPPFFSTLFQRPGGGVDYLHIQLLQCSQSDWLGALWGTLLAWLACGSVRLLLRQAAGAMPKAAHLVFAPLMFMLQSQYSPSASKLALALTLALVFAAGNAHITPRSLALRWLAAWSSMAAVYGLSGLEPVFLWTIASIAVEWGANRPHKWWGCLNLLLAAGTAVMVNVVVVGIPIGRSLDHLAGHHLEASTVVFATLLVTTVACLKQFAPKPSSPTGDPARLKTSKQASPHKILVPSGGLWALWVACLLVECVFAHRGFEWQKQQQLRLDYLAANHQWASFMALARTQTNLTAAARINLVRALHQAGQLPENLFGYPVAKIAELLPGLDEGLEACPALSAAMLELGQVNQAERFAFEALEKFGEQPGTLRLLAQINILKGHPQAAGNFLHLLRQNPFHARWAAGYLERLETDPRLGNDAEIARLRSVMVTTDYVDEGSPTSTLMKQLLHTNPTNRMAFEFLMAHYLVSAQLDKFMESLELGRALADPAMPRHYEEAALLAARLKIISQQKLAGLKIREETKQRYLRFEASVKRHRTDLPAARQALAREYGDTYWFFFLYDSTAAYNAPAKMKG